MVRQRPSARRGAASSRSRATGASFSFPAADEGNGGAPRSKPEPGGAKARDLAAGLYVVSTPIGNLGDITLRAIDVLSRADVIACEDTRITARLLARYEIEGALTPYHDRNARRVRPGLVKRLAHGESVALVSDAGTPLVSDPGYKLVRAAIEGGVAVITIPGPSAVLAALASSGLPTDRFLFSGFLPPRQGARVRALEGLKGIDATLVILESPGRTPAALADMARVLGARQAAVARELTKRFEDVRRDSLPELAAHYRKEGAPKGEVVIVVSPPLPESGPSEGELEELLRVALKTMTVSSAAAAVAADTGLSRRRVYARALRLRGD